MTEIRYHDLAGHLQKESRGGKPSWPPVYLLFGEEVLYKKALDKILTAILGAGSREVNCEMLEGLNENVPAALEHINTYSLLSDCKIVALTDARVFHSRQNKDKL